MSGAAGTTKSPENNSTTYAMATNNGQRFIPAPSNDLAEVDLDRAARGVTVSASSRGFGVRPEGMGHGTGGAATDATAPRFKRAVWGEQTSSRVTRQRTRRRQRLAAVGVTGIGGQLVLTAIGLVLLSTAASAHTSTIDISCTQVEFVYQNFPHVTATAHESVVVNGVEIATHDITFQGPGTTDTITIALGVGLEQRRGERSLVVQRQPAGIGEFQPDPEVLPFGFDHDDRSGDDEHHPGDVDEYFAVVDHDFGAGDVDEYLAVDHDLGAGDVDQHVALVHLDHLLVGAGHLDQHHAVVIDDVDE